jgi:hypothetical protein
VQAQRRLSIDPGLNFVGAVLAGTPFIVLPPLRVQIAIALSLPPVSALLSPINIIIVTIFVLRSCPADVGVPAADAAP